MTAALAFFTSRLGMVLVAAISCFLWGYTAASNGASTTALKNENASLRSNIATFEAATETAEAEALSLRTKQESLQGKLDDYAAEIAGRKGGASCRLSANDIKRLRDLQ